MTTKIDEIGSDIYRLSTFVPEVGPNGLTFNQFLIDDDEPLLFHTGHRPMFAPVREAIERVMPVERLRWIGFGHVESDECGSMNELLAVAPRAQVAHGVTGCLVELNTMCDRLPRQLADGETMTLGSKVVRRIDTPHVPHAWDAGVLFEETTGTLLCGDLFTHGGDGAALTDADIVSPTIEFEDMFRYSSLAPTSPATVARLADLAPTTLGLMHGSSYSGDCAGALRDLAVDYAARIARAV